MIPKNLIRAARTEILRQLGTGSRDVNAFKSRSGTGARAVVNLIKESMIPFLLEELIKGGSASHWRKIASNAQIALRFPGDGCAPNTTITSREHFGRLKRGWHIDGTASNERPKSAFFGEIRNFNVLIG